MLLSSAGDRGKNMYRNEMHVEFLSISQNESLARMVVAAFITQLNPTIEELTDIRTAVSEAVTNSIIHGYGNSNGTVYMDCEIEDQLLTVAILYIYAHYGSVWNGLCGYGGLYGLG